MNKTTTKLAKSLKLDPTVVSQALAENNLVVVWDPDDVMPESVLAVNLTTVIRDGKESNRWWTLRPLIKGKHTSRSTGEVHTWRA